MIHLECTLLVHHHHLGTGTPLCSHLTQGQGGLLQDRMQIGSLGLLCPIVKASRLQWIESVDSERERQRERFDCDAPQPLLRGQGWDRDFARGLCLFLHHFLMYCIVLMRFTDLGPPPADDRYPLLIES